MTENVRIYRHDSGEDDELLRLAQLDSAPPPTGPVLVAEVDGEPRAALVLEGGRAIADPFHRTAELVALLELRARQERNFSFGRSPDGRRRAALRPRLSPLSSTSR